MTYHREESVIQAFDIRSGDFLSCYGNTYHAGVEEWHKVQSVKVRGVNTIINVVRDGHREQKIVPSGTRVKVKR